MVTLVPAHAKKLQWYLTLIHPVDCSPPGSSVHGILWAGILECGLPCLPPGDLLDPGIKPISLRSPALACSFFTTEPLGKPGYFRITADLK